MHDMVVLEQQRDIFLQQQDLSLLWAVVRQPHPADADMAQEVQDAYHTLHSRMEWAPATILQGSPPEDIAVDQQEPQANLNPACEAALEAEAAATMAAAAASSTTATPDTELLPQPAAEAPAPPLKLSDLNAQQKAFIDAVLGMVPAGPASHEYQLPKVIFLRGGPGTGKTATLQLLLQLLEEQQVNMLFGATTAVAAQRLGRPGEADTIDSLLGLWVGQKFGSLPADSALRKKLAATQVCICDVFSMLTFAKLMYVRHRLRMATQKGSPVKLLILAGDEQQLPPVCRHRLNAALGYCTKCHMCKSPVWWDAEHFELQQVYRQAKDRPFMLFLNAARPRNPTAENIQYIFDNPLGPQCFVPENSLDDLWCAGVTVLCTHVDLVKDSNRRALLWHEQQRLLRGIVHHVQPDTDAWMSSDLNDWVDEHQLLTHVAAGAPGCVYCQHIQAAGHSKQRQGHRYSSSH
eukprot:GHUV01018483.1.p1 GENE.GHUV01018483.1~~GHUV01018483.1.p1  ORF type:complete len:463 (+),score=120.29 GHUV01018483.1:57-1445(+)